jgi:hypothetical protein
MTSLCALACGLIVLSGIPSVQTAAQSEPMAVAPFRAVELRNGAHAILRYGPAQRVTVLKGNPDETEITIASGDRLVVDRCKSKCIRGDELEIEIVTPELASITLAHGGWIQSRGSFPRQAGLDVTVENGGTIDIRSMSVVNVKASVLSGGRILTKPLTAMVANVVQGGNVTYWGEARVTQSIQHGGVIERGNPSEADTPFLDRDGFVTPVQPIPPVPPTEPLRRSSALTCCA